MSSSAQAWASHLGLLLLAFPGSQGGSDPAGGEHSGILSRTVCVLDCVFIRNCSFPYFPLLANTVEVCHLFSLLPITPLSPRQGLSSASLLFSQLPWEAVKSFLGGAPPARPGLCEVLVIQ